MVCKVYPICFKTPKFFFPFIVLSYTCKRYTSALGGGSTQNKKDFLLFMILFSVLRYELLDPENNGDLVKAIYGNFLKKTFYSSGLK